MWQSADTLMRIHEDEEALKGFEDTISFGIQGWALRYKNNLDKLTKIRDRMHDEETRFQSDKQHFERSGHDSAKDVLLPQLKADLDMERAEEERILGVMATCNDKIDDLNIQLQRLRTQESALSLVDAERWIAHLDKLLTFEDGGEADEVGREQSPDLPHSDEPGKESFEFH